METYHLRRGGKLDYQPPEVDMLRVAIEKGFAQSPDPANTPDPDYGDGGDNGGEY